MFERNCKVALETLSRRTIISFNFTSSGFSDQQSFVCYSILKYVGIIQASDIKGCMFQFRPKSNVKMQCESHSGNSQIEGI